MICYDETMAINTLPQTKLSVVETQKYYDQLTELLPRAKKRIVLVSMCVLWGDKTGPLLQEIEKAMDRGVRVHVLLDVYTRLGLGAKESKQSFQKHFAQTLDFLKSIQQKGARIDIVGKIGLNPFKGRYHLKLTVVDDVCFSFGGVNFVDSAFTNHDYMCYGKNAALGDCLEQIATRIGNARVALSDGEVPIGEEASVLFDGGKPRHSTIYERATELARQAKHIWYVSQMAPSGALAQAMRNTTSSCYFNRPEQILEAPARYAVAFDQQRYRTKNNYRGDRYIHAKFMLFELHDGTKALVSGSNNFSWRGVAFGTQEIALYSENVALWEQLQSFIKNHVS